VIAVLALLPAFGPRSSAAQAVYDSICCTVTDTTGAAIPKEHVTLTDLRKDPGKYDRFVYQAVQDFHAFARYDYVNLRLTGALVFGAVLGSGFVLQAVQLPHLSMRSLLAPFHRS
jgi:hypothetical protein